jgi:hypothetical protein
MPRPTTVIHAERILTEFFHTKIYIQKEYEGKCQFYVVLLFII